MCCILCAGARQVSNGHHHHHMRLSPVCSGYCMLSEYQYLACEFNKHYEERKKQNSHRHKNEITDCVSDHFSFHRIEWLAILMHALSLSLRLLSNTPHATKYIMRCQMRLLVNGYYRHDWPHLPLKGIMRRRRHRQRRWRWRMSICSAEHTHANARLSATIDTIWSDTRKNKIK